VDPESEALPLLTLLVCETNALGAGSTLRKEIPKLNAKRDANFQTRTSSKAMDEDAAVLHFSNSETWDLVIMGWAARLPATRCATDALHKAEKLLGSHETKDF
jgi:hypothetical protein